MEDVSCSSRGLAGDPRGDRRGRIPPIAGGVSVCFLGGVALACLEIFFANAAVSDGDTWGAFLFLPPFFPPDGGKTDFVRGGKAEFVRDDGGRRARSDLKRAECEVMFSAKL